MGGPKGPNRIRPPMRPPGEDGPPFGPGWGPPPPGGWGPPPPGGWGPPPEEWGPPPPGGWGPRPPGGWGPPPPGGWGPPPPGGWGPLPPEGWGPPPPPGGWGPRGPPDWGPRGPPPPGWPYPEDWLRHPDDWRPPHPDDWRPPHPDNWRPPHPDDWRPPPQDWGPPPWGPEPPPEPWGPDCIPPGPVPPPVGVPPPLPVGGPPVGVPPPPIGVPPPPIGVPPPPPVGVPPPDPMAFGQMPVPPVPPIGLPGYPPGWTAEPVVEEPMPNPPPDQPEWIKALISAPPTESTLAEAKKNTEESVVPTKTEPEPATTSKPKRKPKADPAKTAKALGLLGKRTFEKPPPGRSTGIISFIGPTFGYIEREDLEKFTFMFDSFFGNPKSMTPGVRVHFTVCMEKSGPLATDVKVAPGGTENVDTEIYEAVVSQPILEPQHGGRQYPGQVYTKIGPLRTNVTFDRKDSTVTLLKNDQVLINLLTDIVSEKRRATNIRPKIPSTFSSTMETREKGVIISLKDNDGVIKSEAHGEIPFDIKENFSDVDFTTEDINEEVEFTITELRAGKRAIRVQREKEPLLLTFCPTGSEDEDENENSDSHEDSTRNRKGKAVVQSDLEPHLKLDTDLYEGIVSQPVIDPTPQMQGFPGQIYANIGPRKTNVTFDHQDCGVTLLKNDHVLINLLFDTLTMKKRAANIKPKVPFTFSYTKEKRDTGIITVLGAEEGIVNSDDHGELPFDIDENFSDTEFSNKDIHQEVEFTVAMVKSKKKAIRLLRMKRSRDIILEEQKRREEEVKKKKREQEEGRKQLDVEKRMEEEHQKEAERKKKVEVAVALAAANSKWTPYGFKMRHPDSLDDISRERFEGTVLKAISRTMKKIKKEPVDGRRAEGGQSLFGQIKIKKENFDEDEEKEGGDKCGGEEEEMKTEVKEEHVEEREEKKNQSEGGKATVDPEKGRLVMTIDGEQKQLTFGPDDLLSTATMFDGDKVRFNIATHQETKEERATYVEILPDSFEESIEQRRHGIVIEFSNDSGLIKCAQNPQLYFHMSEVIEKKKLELNEKVEFSVVPHETADGGNQAIRIKRYTESVFLPARKLGGVGANKGKMTIKLTKPSEDTQTAEADKLKAVVKNLRTQDSKAIGSRRDYSAPRRRYSRSRSRSRSHSRTRAKSRSRSRSKSPPRDQYGRVLKKRRSTSIDRDRKSVRSRRSRSKERSKKRTKSHSKSSSRSRSRSRERSKDRVRKKRNKISKEHEESHKKRSDLSPPSRPVRLMEDELARKKRELEELNEMIAYKKSIVDRDTGQKTCIDYDHGRIAIPLTEYKPVRSILKKRTEGSEYPPRPSQAYDDPYYDRSFSPYQDQVYGDRYVDPYVSRPYSDRPYVDRSYESRPYGEPIYGAPRRYTDRYDVYDEPYDDRYQDLGYPDQRFKDPHYNVKQSQSPDDSLSTPQSASTQHTQATSSSHPPFRPPSPTDPPPRTPSPKLKNTTTRQSPLTEKPPLDRFLDMLNKKVDAEKNSEPVYVTDELLPHERALEDGKGFSRIVGMAHTEQLSGSLGEGQKKQPSPRRSSVERTSEESKMNAEPYDKIQSLLRTIGLKLSTGDVSKLASRAHEKIFSPSSSSTERLNVPSPKEQMRTNRTSSVELDHSHSPSPARSSSLEPLHRHTAVSEYEGFFDPQELEAFKKAQQLQSLTKTIRSTPPTSSLVKPPPGPPPAHFKHPPIPVDMPFGGMTQAPPVQPSTAFTMDSPNYPSDGQLSQRLGSIVGPPPGPSPRHPGQSPPGPPPGPPPRRSGQPPLGPPPGPPPWRPPGPPLFTLPTGHAAFPFIGEPSAAPPPKSGSPLADAAVTARSSTPVTSSSTDDDKSAISTTVARCLKVIETVKSLVVQPLAKQTKSVQFSLPTESSSVSSLQITTGADDDIKTKQKEKLDLYNQRILEKREQHYQEKLARKKQEKNKDGTPIPPEVPESSKPKNVWICGHSLVYWAESRAKSPEVGMQLGMDPSKVTIWWKGIQGMTWPQLLPQLHQLKITWPNPDVLIIHLGGNDMSTDSPTDLLASVKKDLTSMRSIFPQCILVWSNILPRRVWRHSTDSHEVDLVRTTVNRRIQSIVSDLGGTSLTHDNIRCGANTGLYRSDGVHLSPKGIDFFNLNLQDFLEKWEMAVEKN